MSQPSKEVLASIMEQYYRQGKAFEEQSQPKQAAKMYRLAAVKQLEIAKQSPASDQKDQLARADWLSQWADKLESSDAAKGGQATADGGVWSVVSDPGLSFDDVAGLHDVKALVRARVIQPMKNPKLYEHLGLQPGTGVLMFGLPGTGKTTIAKAIAHETGSAFFSIDSAAIYNKYVGDSEKMVKSLFEAARQYDSAVLFFDDFDAIGRDRDSSDQAGGVGARIVAQLLVEMQGVKADGKTTFLFLAATNKPWVIDSALTRPGRFARMIYIPLPDRESRLHLLRMQFRPKPDHPPILEEGVVLDSYADRLKGYNGADIVEFVSSAKYRAAERAEKQGLQSAFVSDEDLSAALAASRSSVNDDDIVKLRIYMEKRDYSIPKEM